MTCVVKLIITIRYIYNPKTPSNIMFNDRKNDNKVLIGGGPCSAFEPYKSVRDELCNSNVESHNSMKCLRKERKNAFHNLKTMFKGRKVGCCLTS